MINLILSNNTLLSISFIYSKRIFGFGELRECVEVDVFEVKEYGLSFVTKGMSICHPTDDWDSRIGMKKALASALCELNREDRRSAQRQLDDWF